MIVICISLESENEFSQRRSYSALWRLILNFSHTVYPTLQPTTAGILSGNSKGSSRHKSGSYWSTAAFPALIRLSGPKSSDKRSKIKINGCVFLIKTGLFFFLLRGFTDIANNCFANRFIERVRFVCFVNFSVDYSLFLR